MNYSSIINFWSRLKKWWDNCIGSIPEESVANLWLALQEKK